MKLTAGERATVAAAVLAEGTRDWFPLAAAGLLASSILSGALSVAAQAIPVPPLDWLRHGAHLVLLGWCVLAPVLWALSVWEAASEVRRWRRSRPFDFAMASRLDAILGPERAAAQ